MTLSKRELTGAFLRLGVRQGHTLLIHSSLRRLGPVEGGALGVVEAALDAVGPLGTVAVPTHTWGTVNAQQPVFHQTLSPSIVGTLTNVFRMLPNAHRGLHPTHSVAAIGARAEEFVAGHERDDTPCSRESPYGKLVTWSGKILFIGVGLECCTFFHGCEEWAECPWLFSPGFEQLYSITADGRALAVPSRRHNPTIHRCYPDLEEPLLRIGALTLGEVAGCPLRLLDARAAAEWLVAELRRDPYLVVAGPHTQEATRWPTS